MTKLSGEPCSAIYLALLEVHAFTGCYYTSALCVKTNLYPVDIVERSVWFMNFNDLGTSTGLLNSTEEVIYVEAFFTICMRSPKYAR